MVAGLDIFTEHFQEYTDQYILIGGGACDREMFRKGLGFRATKDLDIILIVEALTDEFVNHFWQFIKDGEYSIAEVDDKKTFYRFIKPQANGYPMMLELFAKKPETIKEVEGMHLTDIPTGEEASSLSAILMDDDYYNFTLTNSIVSDNLHHANDIALICLKAKAFLNNLARTEAGVKVHDDDIRKHKNDVIRLTATLPADTTVETPTAIQQDIQRYIDILQNEQTDVKPVLKNQGMGTITLEQIIEQLQNTFGLAEPS